jgi:hypothetical protein
MEFYALDDARVRPHHKAADGLIAAVDDPIWDTFKPPLGYRCRCSVNFVSVFELEDRGLIKNGKVVRYLPPSFAFARPDENFKVGAMDWRGAA